MLEGIEDIDGYCDLMNSLQPRIDQIESASEVDTLVDEVYVDICGAVGVEAFKSCVMPQVYKFFRNSFRKAIATAIGVIFIASSKRTREIDGFLRGYALPMEFYDEEEKKKRLEEVVGKFKVILSRCPKIKGVVIFGSYAQGDFHSQSDIDLVLLPREEGEVEHLFYIFLEREFDQSVDLLERDCALSDLNSLAGMFAPGTIVIANKEEDRLEIEAEIVRTKKEPRVGTL